MKYTDIDYVRWALAERLEGMREECPYSTVGWEHHYDDCPNTLDWENGICKGYVPVPLTAEGLIDEGKLRRAVERELGGFLLYYGRCPDKYFPHISCWSFHHVPFKTENIQHDENLAIAYLRAVSAEGF